MNKWNKLVALFFMCMVSVSAHAQEKDDFMRSNGKIYVVVAVVVTIVIGLFIYLVNLDRKISKMEKKS